MPDSGTSRKVLLIIDNSLLIIKRLLNILIEVKTIEKVFTANDYEEAESILTEKKTDIVLLDIQLPGKKGIELLKFIVENYPKIKVVILSNLVSEYYQRLCKKIGAVYFIDKSTDFELIPEILAAL